MTSTITPRCEICSYGPSHRELDMIQCTACKIHVHLQCYFDDVEIPQFVDTGKFTCLACQAVGRTVQAVETQWSTDYQYITQEKRPLKCELCSVSDKVTAMHPLYDYHGKSGRQICRKGGPKDNSSRNKRQLRLAWGHTLCCYYLTKNGFLYGVGANGEYSVSEDDDVAMPDPRPPNPTSILTIEFKAALKVGANPITAFRYYLPDPSAVELDRYRREIKNYQDGIKCTICGKQDKSESVMRIPQQCVAGAKDEFDWESSGRLQVRGKLHYDLGENELGEKETCTVALHVGCARWGVQNKPLLQRVYWYSGDLNECCLYCTKHAEDVESKLTVKKKLPSKPSHDQRNKAVTIKPNSKFDDTLSVPRKSSISSLSEAVGVSKPIKRKSSLQSVDLGTILPMTSIPRKKKQRSVSLTAASTSGGEKDWTLPQSLSSTAIASRRLAHWAAKRPKDRYAELDSNLAVAVNAGERPKLVKNRRELADQKSIITQAKVQQVVDDLMKMGGDQTMDDEKLRSLFRGRRVFWKRQFTELTKDDFISIWTEARNKFEVERRNERYYKKDVAMPDVVVDRVRDDKNEGGSQQDKEVDSEIGGDFGSTEKEKNVMGTEKQDKQPKRCDRWSNLFVGPSFRMGNEFTIKDFEEYL